MILAISPENVAVRLKEAQSEPIYHNLAQNCRYGCTSLSRCAFALFQRRGPGCGYTL